MTLLFMISMMVVMPPLIPTGVYNYGFSQGIIDSKTGLYNAVDACTRYDDTNKFLNCSNGYFTAYKLTCSHSVYGCETYLPELAQNGVVTK